MVHPNERFLFPLSGEFSSAEIFKLRSAVLYRARNLKEKLKISRGRERGRGWSSWSRERVYFLLQKFDEERTFRMEHDGSLPQKSLLSASSRVIYGLNIIQRGVPPLNLVVIYSLRKIIREKDKP